MKRLLTIILAVTLSASFMPVAASASESCPAAKKESKVEDVTFNCHLHCANCVKKVQENLSFEKGVKTLEVSLEKQSIKIGYDPSKTSVEKLQAAIRKLGYKATVQ